MKGNVLSLDPMYSSLHSMIGNVTNSSKMFALVSSYGHKIYPTIVMHLTQSIILVMVLQLN